MGDGHHGASDRAQARLVDDLLDGSRITRGKIELKKRRVDLGDAVSHAVEAIRPLVRESGHELVVSLRPGPVPRDADPARLQQVLANLLKNAAKYTDRGGRTHLDAERDGDEVVLRVRDTGVGIAPDLLPSAFDLFLQADRSQARSQGGLGIGLALVHTLARLHGGSVSARSEGLGKGTEFTVRLRTAPTTVTDRSERDPGSFDATARPKRVLVVDDNVGFGPVPREAPGPRGHDVRVAHEGAGAIDAARGFGPEFVPLDIGLPCMDGYEVARVHRARGTREHRLARVALTGYGQDEDRTISKEAGFDRHLVMPVDLDELGAMLGRPGS